MRTVIGLLFVALAANSAFAVTTSWTNPQGGAWSNPANWSAGIPNANTPASLPELGKPYTVTLTRGSAAQSLEVHAHAGATIAGSGALLTVAGDLVVADTQGAMLELGGVQVNVSGTIRIGTVSGAGALTIGDGSFVAGNVALADNATGTCVVSTAGVLSIPALLSIANGAGSNGSLIVHGNVGNSLGIAIVGQGGSASVTVDGTGASWHQIGQLVVASGGAGSVNVDHGGEVNTNGLLIGAGGAGTLTLRNGASLTTGATTLGAAAGSATIDIADAGSLWTSTAAVSCSGATPNTLRVTWPGTANLPQLTLGAASTLDVIVQPGMQASITCPVFSPMGTLHVAPIAGYEPPVCTFVPIVKDTMIPNTFFAAVESPEVLGQGWFVDIEWGIGTVYGVRVPNPVVTLDVDPLPDVPIGFSTPLKLSATHLVGGISCEWNSVTWTSSDSSIATISAIPFSGGGKQLNSLSPGAVTITAQIGTVVGSRLFNVVPTGTTLMFRASESSAGVIGNEDSGALGDYAKHMAVSANGRWIAFVSKASNLVTGDTDGQSNVFVKDTVTGFIERVVPETPGLQQGSSAPAISADGRFVAFIGNPGFDADAPSQYGAYLLDRLTGDIEAISVGIDGNPMNNFSGFQDPSVSSDGRYVVFGSSASNLVPGDALNTQDIFIRDRTTSETTRIEGPSGPPNGGCLCPAISADGNTIVFESYATNLVDNDLNGKPDIFAWTRDKGIERISVASDGSEGNGYCDYPATSADGSVVDFRSDATNLVAGASGSSLYVRFRATGETRVLDLHADGLEDELYPASPQISGSGRFVVVTVGEDSQTAKWNAVRIDLADRATELASATWNLQPPGYVAYFCGVDHTGATVAFASQSDDLVGFDTNQHTDEFYRRMSGAGDFNGDGIVGSADLAILLGEWGNVGSAADLDRDDIVGASDLATLLGLWSQ